MQVLAAQSVLFPSRKLAVSFMFLRSPLTQQITAPDRLQLRSSFLLTPLPAAGELVVSLLRATRPYRGGSTPVADWLSRYLQVLAPGFL